MHASTQPSKTSLVLVLSVSASPRETKRTNKRRASLTGGTTASFIHYKGIYCPKLKENKETLVLMPCEKGADPTALELQDLASLG